MDGLRRMFEDVREAHVQTALTQADGGVQRGEAAKPNVQRRNGSVRAEFAILLFKKR
jgi:hypothetical protein